jgi:hypothetical protein
MFAVCEQRPRASVFLYCYRIAHHHVGFINQPWHGHTCRGYLGSRYLGAGAGGGRVSFRLTGLSLLLICFGKILVRDVWQLQKVSDSYLNLFVLGAALVFVHSVQPLVRIGGWFWLHFSSLLLVLVELRS